VPGHAGDIYDAATWADEWEEELSCGEGTVIVALEGGFDDGKV